jgi:hypothetical protein
MPLTHPLVTMTTIFGDSLSVGEFVYTIDTSPLESLLASLPQRPVFQKSPFTMHGYRACWRIQQDWLYLEHISPQTLMSSFNSSSFPVRATWVNEILRGFRGDSRRTGWPPYKFFDDEIVMEVQAGRVVREWRLDLRGVRNHTDDELRLSLPSFLWPAHLRHDSEE